MYIAVYGTLMSGHCRAGALAPYADLVAPCRIHDTELYSVHDSFPALVEGTGTVQGELWRARSHEDAVALLAMTDGIEGYRPFDEDNSMYLRRQVEAIIADGEQEGDPVLAYVYVWNMSTAGMRRIVDGDWRGYRREEVA